MENTPENKAAYFAAHPTNLTHIVIPRHPKKDTWPFDMNEGGLTFAGVIGSDIYVTRIAEHVKDIEKQTALHLKSLGDILDEDAIQVAKYAHQLNNTQNSAFVVKRSHIGLVHVTYFREDIQLEYHTSVNQYGCINVNWHFRKTATDSPQSCKINIGEFAHTSSKPLAYVAIIDFLRKKGYAVPFGNLSVEKLIEREWLVVKSLSGPIKVGDTVQFNSKANSTLQGTIGVIVDERMLPWGYNLMVKLSHRIHTHFHEENELVEASSDKLTKVTDFSLLQDVE